MQLEDGERKQKTGKLEKIVGHPNSMCLSICSFQRETECFVLLWRMLLLSGVGVQFNLQLLTYRQMRRIYYEE